MDRILKIFTLIKSELVYRFNAKVKYRSHSHPIEYQFNWSNKCFNRIAVVNYLISISGGFKSNYLEIGCATNALFYSVACLDKVGVDPERGGTHRMTSDEFFLNNNEVFDVVFIDGLHEYTQVHRDTINALNSVKVGGYVAFHDLLPATWKEHHVPRVSGVREAWTGDCWKITMQLMEATGIEFVILDIDHGVGIIKKLSDEWYVPGVSENLISAEFDVFTQIKDSLPIYSFGDGLSKITRG